MNRLAPRIHPLVAAFLPAVRKAVEQHGTPLNVVFPQILQENAAAFHGGKVFYAHKANRSRSLVRAALDSGIGIDVASPGEFDQALECGFPPDRIEATGPKGERFLRRLLEHPGVTINVDNLWELNRIAAHPAKVLLRLESGRRTSRFGLAPQHFDEAFRLIAKNPGSLDLLGLSFHLDTGDLGEKARAVEQVLGLVEKALPFGLRPRVVNLGGGFRQAFLDAPEGFDAYARELRAGLLGQGPPLGWGDQSFGYRLDHRGLRGTPIFHRYTSAVTGPAMLRELLDTPMDGARTIGEVLRESLLEVWIEPGKALVDHAGITIAAVEFSKQASDGKTLVVLDISRGTITPADQEVMLDPVLLESGTGAAGPPAEVFLAGRLCLERDMVSNHLVRLPRLPEPGDLLVFVNTAAYQMDLSASEALMHPTAPKIAAVHRDGRFTIVPDGVDA